MSIRDDPVNDHLDTLTMVVSPREDPVTGRLGLLVLVTSFRDYPVTNHLNTPVPTKTLRSRHLGGYTYPQWCRTLSPSVG